MPNQTDTFKTLGDLLISNYVGDVLKAMANPAFVFAPPPSLRETIEQCHLTVDEMMREPDASN